VVPADCASRGHLDAETARRWNDSPSLLCHEICWVIRPPSGISATIRPCKTRFSYFWR